jgi:hypothetical protein
MKRKVDLENGEKASAMTRPGTEHGLKARAVPESAAGDRRLQAGRETRGGCRPAYRVSVRGAIPPNLVQRIAEVHAAAELQSKQAATRNDTTKGTHQDSLNSNQHDNRRDVRR